MRKLLYSERLLPAESNAIPLEVEWQRALSRQDQSQEGLPRRQPLAPFPSFGLPSPRVVQPLFEGRDIRSLSCDTIAVRLERRVTVTINFLRKVNYKQANNT